VKSADKAFIWTYETSELINLSLWYANSWTEPCLVNWTST